MTFEPFPNGSSVSESPQVEKVARVIITGGTGFIGRPLSLLLIQEGFNVVCLTRNASAADNKGGSGIKFVEWDGKSAAGWSEYAEGASAIINLAGESIGSSRWSTAKRRNILRSRMNAGKAVVEAVASADRKPEVIIQASAIGIYGNRGKEILDERSDEGEGFLAEVAKMWEESTREIENLGIRRVIIRTGMVLGTKGGALARLLLPYRFFVGGPLGSGKQWMSWIHIEDEIRCIQFLMDRKGLNGVFNLTAPHPLQNKLFSRQLGKLLKRPSWFPAPALFLRLFLGKMAEETILTSQRVLPARLEKAGYKFAFPGLMGALAHLLSKNP
jgi:uncharacterized protein (TIGR01777 family)